MLHASRAESRKLRIFWVLKIVAPMPRTSLTSNRGLRLDVLPRSMQIVPSHWMNRNPRCPGWWGTPPAPRHSTIEGSQLESLHTTNKKKNCLECGDAHSKWFLGKNNPSMKNSHMRIFHPQHISGKVFGYRMTMKHHVYCNVSHKNLFCCIAKTNRNISCIL